jgi:EmrB/QacA subfamily drug resistance transporter
MPRYTPWWTFAIVALALFMSMLDTLVVLTALPAIQKALHASVADLEWTVNAYTLAFAVLVIPAAALGDRFGRRRAFLIGVALFTLGSISAAVSDTATELTIARALEGVGGAFIAPMTLTLLTRAFPAERQAAIIGLWSGIAGLGLTLGPLIGGAIVTGWSWNVVFWLNLPVGILLLVLGCRRLDESTGDRRPLDLPGMTLLGLGLLGLVQGLVRGNEVGWGSAHIVSSLALGALLVGAFLRRERLVRAPMIDLELFTRRGFAVANAGGFLMNVAMLGAIFLITLFLQDVQRFSPLQAGLRTMPWMVAITVMAPLAGVLAGRLGARPVVLAGMAAQAVALVWIGHIATATVPYGALLPAFILGGLGTGLAFAQLSAAALAAASATQQGQASGLYNTIRELGSVFGVAVLGAIFQSIARTPVLFMDGFRAAIFAGAGILVVGGVITSLLPGRAGARQAAPDTVVEAA